MNYIDYDIEREIESVKQAVSQRCETRRHDAATLRELDELVCMTSRTLYSRFVDSVAWRDSADEETYEVVRAALLSARDCIPPKDYRSKKPNPIRESVARRYSDFEQFASNLLKR